MTYTFTEHALVRVRQRSGLKDKRKHSLENWANQLIAEAKTIYSDSESFRKIYKGHLFVVGRRNNNIITYYKTVDTDNEYSEMYKKAIEKTRNSIFKELNRVERKLKISLHENKLNQLKVHNPKTKNIIQTKIDSVEEELMIVEDKKNKLMSLDGLFDI